jgi:hypothetical protein
MICAGDHDQSSKHSQFFPHSSEFIFERQPDPNVEFGTAAAL